MNQQEITIQHKLALVCLATSITGCSGIPYESSDGTLHHLIIGIGIISIPKKNMNNDVIAIKSQALGINLSTHPDIKLGVGISSYSVIEIPEQSDNVLVEVSQSPFGGISIITNPKITGEKNEKK